MFRESRASSWRHMGNTVWLPVGFTSCHCPVPAAGLWSCPTDTKWTVLWERKWICLEWHIQLQEERLTPERLSCECARSWWMPCWKRRSCGMFRWAAERPKRRTEKLLLWGKIWTQNLEGVCGAKLHLFSVAIGISRIWGCTSPVPQGCFLWNAPSVREQQEQGCSTR